MTTPSPALGGDLASLVGALGVDTSNLTDVPGATRGGRLSVYMGPGPALGRKVWDDANRPPARGPMYGSLSPEAKAAFDAVVAGNEAALEREHLGLTEGAPTRDEMPYDAAVNSILGWTDAELQRFKDALVAAGRLDEDAGRRELEAAWEQCVQDAARWQASGHSDVTPWDMIGLYSNTDLNGEPNRPTVRKVVTTDIGRLLDQDGARSVLNSALSQALGRRATDQEIDEFQVAVNDAQRRAPSINTRTTSTDALGNATVTEQTTGGFDQGAFTDSYAEDNFKSEYGAYQAATTYMDALQRALGATTG